SFFACSVSASTSLGCACPSRLTAMPLPKSRYRSPSVEISHEPSPRSNTTFKRAYVSITARDGPEEEDEVAAEVAVADVGCVIPWQLLWRESKRAALRVAARSFTCIQLAFVRCQR